MKVSNLEVQNRFLGDPCKDGRVDDQWKGCHGIFFCFKNSHTSCHDKV